MWQDYTSQVMPCFIKCCHLPINVINP
jgi:hypothetical protein